MPLNKRLMKFDNRTWLYRASFGDTFLIIKRAEFKSDELFFFAHNITDATIESMHVNLQASIDAIESAKGDLTRC